MHRFGREIASPAAPRVLERSAVEVAIDAQPALVARGVALPDPERRIGARMRDRGDEASSRPQRACERLEARFRPGACPEAQGRSSPCRTIAPQGPAGRVAASMTWYSMPSGAADSCRLACAIMRGEMSIPVTRAPRLRHLAREIAVAAADIEHAQFRARRRKARSAPDRRTRIDSSRARTPAPPHTRRPLRPTRRARILRRTSLPVSA